MARSGINRRGIKKLTRDLQKEFDKNPVSVPIEGRPHGRTASMRPATVNYNAPVTFVEAGDHAQIAWGNDSVVQGQEKRTEVAHGFEDLAHILTIVRQESGRIGLRDTEKKALDDHTEALLREVTKESPDGGLVQRGVLMVKGLLAPVASGVGQGVTTETADLTRGLIEQLGSALPM